MEYGSFGVGGCRGHRRLQTGDDVVVGLATEGIVRAGARFGSHVLCMYVVQSQAEVVLISEHQPGHRWARGLRCRQLADEDKIQAFSRGQKQGKEWTDGWIYDMDQWIVWIDVIDGWMIN